MTRTEMHTF